MDIKNKVLDFVKYAQKLYFVENDFNTLLKLFDKDIVMIGTGKLEFCFYYDEIVSLFSQKEKYVKDKYDIYEQDFQISALSDKVYAVYGKSFIKEITEAHLFEPIEVHYTFVCKIYNKDIKLLHLHFSIPDENQKIEDMLPKRYTDITKEILQKLIEEKTKELNETRIEYEMLLYNIPGGVCRYQTDDSYSFSFISESYFKLTGYTKEQIKTNFHNSFLETILEEDRKDIKDLLCKQLREKGSFELEYRIVHCSGKILWVYERGKLVKDRHGKQSIYCVLIDITSAKKLQEALRLSEERYQIIIDQSTEVIFEWNLKKDIIFFSRNWEKKYGYSSTLIDAYEKISNSVNIYEKDKQKIKQIVSKKILGSPYSEFEIRIKNVKGVYLWCKVRSTTIFDGDKKPDKIIGIIIDIDTQKKETEKLIELAQKDSLTKLYNKITVQTLIENKLKQSTFSDSHALMIVDIDDFKSVNDSLGHLFGDAVLTDISASILQLFRSSDIVGRIGGDEFIVFLNDIPSSAVEKRADEVTNIFHKTYSGIKKNYEISGSVGVAVYPRDGKDFTTLFQNADAALYQAKIQGKNCFQLFNSSMKITHYIKKWDTMETSSNQESFSDNLISNIFHILYEEKDTSAAIDIISGLIGKYYGVSRVYIFENTDESGLYCSNTFEWCNDGITPQIKNLQGVSYAELNDYANNFNEDGIFYCNDVNHMSEKLKIFLKNQGIYSMLQCSIVEDGKFKGFIGFDECKNLRLWTKEEIQTLSLIAKMVGIFLLKMRKEQSEKRKKTFLGVSYEFQHKVKQLLKNSNSKYAVLYGNISKFKYINNNLGYEEGNFILNYVYNCIYEWIDEQETITKASLDRFIVLIKYENEEVLYKRLNQLKVLLHKLSKKKTNKYHLDIVWGVYIIENKKENIISMLDKAMLASKEAKNIYGRHYYIYSKQLDIILTQEKEIENAMEFALKNKEFVLCIQPQIELSTKKVAGAEVLVRWKKDSKEYNYPDSFIPLFEKNGFVLDLDYYVFEESCKLVKKWMEQSKELVALSVNFSALHMKEPDFFSSIKAIIEKYQLPASCFILELTEQAFAGEMKCVSKIIHQLKQYGFQISIDDFGTGYSSFASLKLLPVDSIKLDKSFFSGNHPSDRDKILIAGMTNIAHQLGLKVIAEGVETKEQNYFLEQQNCDYIQGFFVKEPLSVSKFEDYLWKVQ